MESCFGHMTSQVCVHSCTQLYPDVPYGTPFISGRAIDDYMSFYYIRRKLENELPNDLNVNIV